MTTSTPQQTVNVSGSSNNVAAAGRDVYQTNVQQKPEFFEPDMKQYQPPIFTSPQATDQLAATIEQQRLLVLGGSYEINKLDIARHLAWFLSDQLRQVPLPLPQAGIVKEWYRSSDSQSLVVEIQKATSPTIFILPEIAPKDIRYDILRLKDAADLGKNYVIISTDTPSIGWKLDSSTQIFWRDLDIDTLYKPQDLANVLIQKFNAEHDKLPPNLRKAYRDPAQLLIDKLELRQVAAHLKTPDNIGVFVQLLCTYKTPVQAAIISSLVGAVLDSKRPLRLWYHKVLSPREQLLALGLCFFDGLFEDQCFAAFEQLVEQVWQRRDSSLRALDYSDLDELRQFFHLVKTKSSNKIESSLPDQRRTLFELAWDSHRRQILNALPILARLVRQSVDYRSVDGELYGTEARCTQIRQVIGETLSDIGLVSSEAVQDTLLQLAADEQGVVQAVAAQALARWRNYNHDTELFAMLKYWQQEKRFTKLIEGILAKSDGVQGEGSQALAHIRATVALTVGYAALYDRPNHLSDQLYDLLKELADDRSPLVRERFRSYTLPIVVPQHLIQLEQEDFLPKMLDRLVGDLDKTLVHDIDELIDLPNAIGASLGIAYRSNPDKVLSMLNSWYQYCVRERPRYRKETTGGFRELLLAAVVLTYGWIRCDENIGTLDVHQVFDRLQRTLIEERNILVRRAVMFAVIRQAQFYFQRVDSDLQRLVAHVSEDERDVIVDLLTDVYLKQRAQLKGGDEEIKVKGKAYRIWLDPQKRELTVIESAMFRWIKGANNSIAQQIATKTSVAFAQALDQNEESRVKAFQEWRKREAEDQDAAGKQPEGASHMRKHAHLGFYTGQVVPLLSTIDNLRYRRVVRGLLAEALAQHKSSKDAMSFVLSKWRRASDAEIKIVAAQLGRALWLAEQWLLVFMLSGVLCLVIVLLLRSAALER